MSPNCHVVSAGVGTVEGRLDRSRLEEDGYVVVHDVPDRTAAAEVVGSLGDLVPQYNGLLTHEVTHRPGNDHRAYSQSANTILAHTEAPGWDPSPAYLALFCHRQARCGGGHTDLLDIRRLVDALEPAELTLMTDAELTFPGPDGGVRTAMLGADDTGRTALRFSYNLLTAADYDPHHDSDVDDSRCRSAGPVAGWRIASATCSTNCAPAC